MFIHDEAFVPTTDQFENLGVIAANRASTSARHQSQTPCNQDFFFIVVNKWMPRPDCMVGATRLLQPYPYNFHDLGETHANESCRAVAEYFMNIHSLESSFNI